MGPLPGAHLSQRLSIFPTGGSGVNRNPPKETRESGRVDLRIDHEWDTAVMLIENVKQDASHWLTLSGLELRPTPIGYIHLKELIPGSHITRRTSSCSPRSRFIGRLLVDGGRCGNPHRTTGTAPGLQAHRRGG